jgi:hypothetical protein
MLHDLGFDRNKLTRDTLIEYAHQVAMRTNLRVLDSTKPVEIIVADKFTAMALGKILGTSDIQRIGNIMIEKPTTTIPKPVPYSQRDKDRRSVGLQLLRSLETMDDASEDGDPHATKTLPKVLKTIRKKGSLFVVSGGGNQEEGGAVVPLEIIFHSNEKALRARDFTIGQYDLQGFVAFMRQQSGTPVDAKDKWPLFNMTTFEMRDGEDGYRRQNNFKCAYGLVLDFDNGQLSPEDFERIFWLDAGPEGKTSFIICNSFSRSARQPNRYRVILPFRNPCPSLEIFQLIYDSLVQRIRVVTGYEDSEIGLDKVCRSGIQSFRLPCTNRNQREWAFFKIYGMTTREFMKSAIDPLTYKKLLPIPRSKRDHDSWNRQIKNETPEFLAIKDLKKAELMAMKEGRHQMYYDFGILLRGNGYSLDEIHVELSEIAANDPKMRRKAKDIMTSLYKYAGVNPKPSK